MALKSNIPKKNTVKMTKPQNAGEGQADAAIAGALLSINPQVQLPVNKGIHGMAAPSINTSRTAQDPNFINVVNSLLLDSITYDGDTFVNWGRAVAANGKRYNSTDPQFNAGINTQPSPTYDFFTDIVAAFAMLSPKLPVNVSIPTTACGSPYYNALTNQNQYSGKTQPPDDLNVQATIRINALLAAGITIKTIYFGAEQCNPYWDAFFIGKDANNTDDWTAKAQAYVAKCNALQTYLMQQYPNQFTYMWDSAPAHMNVQSKIIWNQQIALDPLPKVLREYMNWFDLVPSWGTNDNQNLQLMNAALPNISVWLDAFVATFPNKKVGILQTADSGDGAPSTPDIYNTWTKCLADVRMYMEIISWEAANNAIWFVNYQNIKRFYTVPTHSLPYTLYCEYDSYQILSNAFSGNKNLIPNVTNNLPNGIHVMAFNDANTGKYSLLVTNETNTLASTPVNINNHAVKTFSRTSQVAKSLSDTAPTVVTFNNETTLNIPAFSNSWVNLN